MSDTRCIEKIVCQLCIVLVFGWGSGSSAQSPVVQWQDPINLSRSEWPSWSPAIVSDDFGYVHVFWSENFGGTQRDTGNTIMYSRWDGEYWEGPNDVLTVPGEGMANYVAVDVDSAGRLHAVWTGQSLFYYSNALAWEAHDARAWSAPLAVAADSARSGLESDIVAEADGRIHIVFATPQSAGVYAIHSDDGGVSWTSPVRLSDSLREPEQGCLAVKIVSDPVGRLHVVWQTYQEEGFGQSVYYTRSLDRGETWEKPRLMGWREDGDFEVGWAYLTVRGDSELHLIHVGGFRSGTVGRTHHISTDGGGTWEPARHIITDIEGVNGYVIPIVDSQGSLHLIINGRPSATQATGIYYATWQADAWSTVSAVAVEGDFVANPHRIDAAVRLGNELHVVFWNEAGAAPEEILYLRGNVAAVPPQAAVPVPSSRVPTLVPARAEVVTKDATAAAAEGLPTLSATEGRSSASTLSPIVVGTMASAGAVAAAVACTLRSRRVPD
jgi:hypothetical protein